MSIDSTIDDRPKDESGWDEKCAQIRARTREIYLSDKQIECLQGLFHYIIFRNTGLEYEDINKLSERDFKCHPKIQAILDWTLDMLINNDQLTIRFILKSYGVPNPAWPKLNL